HRLPHLLFALISIYSVYKLTKYLSDKTTAKLAAAMLATAQAFILSITDARMETPLSAAIIFSIWQLIVYIDKRKLINILLAAFGTAIAFSTKGWLGPVLIFLSGFFYIVLNKKWNLFASLKTWSFIPLFALFISPVLYAYYLQFDLHPEKIIRGEGGRSGIRFILWDQLFERASGFDVKKRHSGYFFLYHTFLWSFFPWSVFAYVALVFWLRRMFYLRKWKSKFHFATLTFGFILFAISFSQFKMPHYTVMLLPLAALFTAPYVRLIMPTTKATRFFYPLQVSFVGLILLLTVLLNFYFFQPHNVFIWIAGITLLLLLLGYLFGKRDSRPVRIIYLSVGPALVANFFLNYNVFPNLTKFQAGQELVKLVKKNNLEIPKEKLILLDHHAHSFDFYMGRNHKKLEGPLFARAYPHVKDCYFLVS
ncbi:MAG TPA: glycosyltransferase family 39 protein, partial [Flavobacterium sp.]|nr:glycosyltransferase family 39 protein [Flavobacterium sp.]